VTDRVVGVVRASKCGDQRSTVDANLVGHLNRISIVAALIVCCWRLWLPPVPTPDEAEAAVTLGRVGLSGGSGSAALTDLGEAYLTR
jgi:hypothetical protein